MIRTSAVNMEEAAAVKQSETAHLLEAQPKNL
jgi:hypothetical protein